MRCHSQALLVLSSIIASVHAIIDTSPAIIVSNTQNVESASPEDSVMSLYGFEDYLWGAIGNCKFDSYIFVSHPNVTDADVSAKNMPFLMHAVDKARFSAPFPSLPHNEITQNSGEKALQFVQDTCKAELLVADTASDTPIAPLSSESPRVITADYATGTDSSAVDESLRKIIGHLPSGNFLLIYQTTPRQSRRDADRPSIMGDKPIAASENDEKVPYESLFRNYQFFSPAIFMGLIVSGLLVFIFLVAFRSVDSLQISSAAFEPRRQPNIRKQQ